MPMTLPLRALFARALSSASQAYNLPANGQTDVVNPDLRDLEFRINALGLFSSNETCEDIGTRDLIYLLVPFVIAEVGGRVRNISREVRFEVLAESQRYLKTFLSNLGDYEIIPEDERTLHKHTASTIADPGRRRETKIKQFRKEKELRNRIETLRKRRCQSPTFTVNTDFDLILSLLPSESLSDHQHLSDDEESDSDTDDILRETTLLLLRLTCAQAHAQLESINQEMELLRNAPPSPSQENGENEKGKERDEGGIWTLDAPTTKEGPVLDPNGKPLRPFKILPSGASTRNQLHAQVFAPDHRLPTMSIDEYLEVERQRGKFISGGGPAHAAKPTSSEQLTIDAEQDGTFFGEEMADKKRVKDEKWAQFTDVNPKGSGNTMNRG